MKWKRVKHELTIKSPPTCKRCGGVFADKDRETAADRWCPARKLEYNGSYDWGRWMLEWSGARVAGKKFKQSKAYHHSGRWETEDTPAERNNRLRSFFQGRAWTAHSLGIAKGYLVCGRCGETGTSEKKLLAEPCPGFSPVVSAFAWGLLRSQPGPSAVAQSAAGRDTFAALWRKRWAEYTSIVK